MCKRRAVANIGVYSARPIEHEWQLGRHVGTILMSPIMHGVVSAGSVASRTVREHSEVKAYG